VSIIRDDGSALTFDGVLDYTLSSSVNVTDHPIEDGSTVSDHAQVQPKRLTVRGIVTETPYDNVDNVGGPDRVARALEFLDAAAGELLTVVTERFGTLENMALTSYPTTADQVRRLLFDVEFKAVRIAVAGLIDIPPSAPATPSAASGLPDEQDVGEQPTTSTEDEPAKEEGDTSLLLDLLTSVGSEP
jgi:hypothetical protein